METERDVLNSLIKGDPQGLTGLLERHGALFHEGLMRFYGEAAMEQISPFKRVLEVMSENLKKGDFNDLTETFYNWVVKDAWRTFIAIKQEESGVKGHLEPEILVEASDRLNRAAFDENTENRVKEHLDSCQLCSDLLEKCKDIPVEKRHAGAPFPQEFQAVLDQVSK